MKHTKTALALALIVVTTTTGCTSPAPDPAPTASARPSRTSTAPDPRATAPAPATTPTADTAPEGAPEPAAVEDPSVVADRVAGLLWAGDTRTDASPADTARRAAPWLTPTALEQVTSAPAIDADWLELAAHSGRRLAAVDDVDELVGRTPDTTTVAVRTRGVRLTPVSEDGWTGEQAYVVATFRLTRTQVSAPWLVDDVEAMWALDPTGDEYRE